MSILPKRRLWPIQPDMTQYFRPILSFDPAAPDGALRLGGGALWFTHAEVLERGRSPLRVPVNELPADITTGLTAPRADVAGLAMTAPRIMGILNVTPDSFSDGGQHDAPDLALAHVRKMVAAGADIIDVGGESTRPGAAEVDPAVEISRTAPVIAAIRARMDTPVSIDTRKAAVGQAAMVAGANVINDVAGFTYDPDLAKVAAATNAPVCVMHAQGDPQTMQQDPQYGDVLLDVFDFIEERIAWLVAQGIPRSRIITDPGIGFGKALDHNLTLLQRISLFHTLGCPILLGVSRKRFVGTIGNAPAPADRAPGSVAIALHAASQGVQILRVHDVYETRSALNLWQAAVGGYYEP